MKNFNFNRLYLTIYHELSLNKYRIILFSFAYFWLAFISCFLKLQAAETVTSSEVINNITYNTYQDNFRMYFMFMLLNLGLTSLYFENKINASYYLSLPASALEKFTALFITKIILNGIIGFWLFWLGANLARISVDSSLPSFNLLSLISYEPAKFWEPLRIWSVIVSVISSGCLFFSGPFIFGKNSSLKAVLLGVAILMVIIGPLASLDYFSIKPKLRIVLFCSILSISWLIFLGVGYYKLRQKQV